MRSVGWSILARRWRRPEGELDLVCRDPGFVLVAVEVKLRRMPRSGDAVESVDHRRIRRVRHALASYAAAERAATPAGLRIDLVAVTPAGDRWRLARYPSIDAW